MGVLLGTEVSVSDDDDSVTGLPSLDELDSVVSGAEVESGGEKKSVKEDESEVVGTVIVISADDEYVSVELDSVSVGKLEEGETSMLVEDGITGLSSVEEGGIPKEEVLGALDGKDQVNVPFVIIAGKPDEMPVAGVEAESVHVVPMLELSDDVVAGLLVVLGGISLSEELVNGGISTADVEETSLLDGAGISLLDVSGV
jgi:hypothetical protein